VITGNTRLGSENEVFPFACIGGDPQDLRHNGEATTLIIGNKNIFREHVTVNRGTVHGGGSTVIGNNNLIMAYSHIAHDCIIGDRVVIANNGTLAGHVEVYDYAVFGGGVQVASFMRIGESAMLAAGAMVDRDVPPFSMVAGDRAKLQGTNRVGMIRREFSSDVRLEIKQIIKQLIRKDELKKIVMEYSDRTDVSKESLRLIEFLSSASRGVVR
jgi:UDP-N-acetylglucosamine acyltransferase